MSEMTMPPGLMEALGGAAPPQQPAPEQPAPEMSAAEHLRQAIEHVQAAMQAEPDDIDSAKLAQAAKVLYDVAASRQKESDSVMGSAPVLRALRRGGQSY